MPKIPIDAEHFGVIHGDINASNFYVKDDLDLSVFDWDQTERGWYAYDLAQMIWGIVMTELGGFPMSSQKVPGISSE